MGSKTLRMQECTHPAQAQAVAQPSVIVQKIIFFDGVM